MPAPTVFPASFTFPSPICCPSRIVVPIDNPAIPPVIVCMKCDPVATAEMSDDFANSPTIRRSTAPYMDCRNSAKSTGSANRISGPAIGPDVKLFS